jgi:hypothetical protein
MNATLLVNYFEGQPGTIEQLGFPHPGPLPVGQGAEGGGHALLPAPHGFGRSVSNASAVGVPLLGCQSAILALAANGVCRTAIGMAQYSS